MQKQKSLVNKIKNVVGTANNTNSKLTIGNGFGIHKKT